DECRPLLAQLIKATDAYASYTKSRQEQIVGEFQQRYEWQRNLIIVVCALAILIAAGASVAIIASITKPIDKAVHIARTVAGGDLTSAIVVDRSDEAGALLQ